MIEHKFFVIDDYKDGSDAARELDKLMMYEGFVVICSVGKKSNTLLLRRILEEQQPQNQPLSLPSNKRNTKKRGARFPDAIHS